MTPVIDGIITTRTLQFSRREPSPSALPDRPPLRRGLPRANIPKRPTLIFKHIGRLGFFANCRFVAILPVTLAGHQAVPSVENLAMPIQPEALGDRIAASPVPPLR